MKLKNPGRPGPPRRRGGRAEAPGALPCALVALLLVLLAGPAAAAGSAPAAESANEFTVEAIMPPFEVTGEDTYLCTSIQLPDRPLKLVEIEARADQSVVHHILMFGAPARGWRSRAEPGSPPYCRAAARLPRNVTPHRSARPQAARSRRARRQCGTAAWRARAPPEASWSSTAGGATRRPSSCPPTQLTRSAQAPARRRSSCRCWPSSTHGAMFAPHAAVL
jgi:hypothetical protein